jgi:hypothetical protein
MLKSQSAIACVCACYITTCEGYTIGSAMDPERCGGPAVREQFRALKLLHSSFVDWFLVETAKLQVDWKAIGEADSKTRSAAIAEMWRKRSRDDKESPKEESDDAESQELKRRKLNNETNV